jgi:hypothetical protein
MHDNDLRNRSPESVTGVTGLPHCFSLRARIAANMKTLSHLSHLGGSGSSRTVVHHRPEGPTYDLGRVLQPRRLTFSLQPQRLSGDR